MVGCRVLDRRSRSGVTAESGSARKKKDRRVSRGPRIVTAPKNYPFPIFVLRVGSLLVWLPDQPDVRHEPADQHADKAPEEHLAHTVQPANHTGCG